MFDASATLKLSPLLPAFDFCSVPGFRIVRALIVNYAIKPLMIHPCAIHVPILDMSHPAVAHHLQVRLQYTWLGVWKAAGTLP
jgi:hypothetical protein